MNYWDSPGISSIINTLNQSANLMNSIGSTLRTDSMFDGLKKSNLFQALGQINSGSLLMKSSALENILNSGAIEVLHKMNSTFSLIDYSGIEKIGQSLGAIGRLAQMNSAFPSLAATSVFSDNYKLSSLWGLSETLNKFQEQLNKSGLTHNWYKEIDWDSIHNQLDDYDIDDIIINPDGTIINNSTSVSPEEVRDIVNNILEETGLISVPQTMNSLIRKVDSSNSFVKFIILNIMLWLFTQFAEPFVDPITNNFYSMSLKGKAQLVRIIQGQATKVFNSVQMEISQLKQYKFISKGNLPLWQNRSTKSQKIGHCYFGQTVVVIEKKRNWSRIVVLYEDESMITGWTFSRYLAELVSKKSDHYHRNNKTR